MPLASRSTRPFVRVISETESGRLADRRSVLSRRLLKRQIAPRLCSFDVPVRYNYLPGGDLDPRLYRVVRNARVRRGFSYALARLSALAAIGSFVAVVLFVVIATPARAPRVDRALFESSGDLDVVPFPGTPDVPPGTRIDFPALAPAQLDSVRVVGSRSGLHAGTLTAQPGGRGTQFRPDRPFVTGERVSVSAALRSEPAAAAAGVPGARRLRFSFRITTAAPADVRGFASPGCGGSVTCERAMAQNARSAKKQLTHTFHSAPQLHPPMLAWIGKDTDTAAGDIFLDAQHSGQNGPYILDPAGGLVVRSVGSW